ncbi:MAG: diguanylate cyclase, partial [Acidimicrobiales bacterium]
GLAGVGPLSAGYLVLAGAVEWVRRSGSRARLVLHRLMVPLDAVYLLVVTVPSGGPRSILVVLFSVHLIALTLLASPRTGLRIALWDSFLFVAIPVFSLSPAIGQLLGNRVVADPPTSEIALSIMGFWAVAICTAAFSTVSERELRRSRSQLAALAEMAAALETARDVTSVAGTLLRSTVSALGFGRGVFFQFSDGAVHALRYAPTSSSGPDETAVETLLVFAPDRPDAVLTQVAAAAEPILLRRLDPVSNALCDQLLPDGRNVVVLVIEDTTPTMMLLERGGRDSGERMSRRSLVVLSQFTAHAALALRNVALLAERARLAAVDGLTGLANRREFDRTLAREVSRSLRVGEPLSLAIVDIDHFKAINDTRGHLAGDEILRRLSRVFEQASRDMDVAARFGGEEFALILPGCAQDDAVVVLERLTTRLAATPGLEGVTVSAGVACLPPDLLGPGTLVAAADDALYRAKRAGRNRITVAEGSDAPVRIGPTPAGPSDPVETRSPAASPWPDGARTSA